jgi:hypothetical protein
MFISTTLLSKALGQFESVNPFFGISFLAFKKAGLPIGETREVVFSQIADDILNEYYRACHSHNGFYQPFHTSDKSDRWVKPRYGSTSLQRITTDTFGDCLLHQKKTSSWGWRSDYVKKLQKHLGSDRIPAFFLAIWLFRSDKWPTNVQAVNIRDKLFTQFFITPEEKDALFDLSIPKQISSDWFSETPVGETELLDILGTPPGAEPEEGAALHFLETNYIGPSKRLRYDPAERLNILTGDNSLGKTFVLECIWWALTGSELDQPIFPRQDASKSQPRISFGLSTERGRLQKIAAHFDWERQSWTVPSSRKAVSGLVLYARHDGSFAVWDPARAKINQEKRSRRDHILFSRQEIWDGLPEKQSSGRIEWICNGLIRDWITWQTGGQRYEKLFKSFVSCLYGLSPSKIEHLEPGEPIRLAPESREIPTLKMSYDNVPIVQASAGVQRILALAYLLVWAWHEHLSLSTLIRKKPQRRLVLIMDEVEAHLHPRWQRVIVPALMRVISELASTVSPQIHLATHSPMIMASAETVFDEKTDRLHHLKLINRNVELEELPFRKRGRADLWLVSEVFGLGQARSLPAEEAIEEAKAIQISKQPDEHRISEIHRQLVQHLAADDDFWPRWTFFAKEHGVKI